MILVLSNLGKLHTTATDYISIIFGILILKSSFFSATEE